MTFQKNFYILRNMNEPTKRCPFCDEEIRLNAIKCKHCGSFITDSKVHASSNTAVRQALINRFEIVEEIGRGGMGVVYKARQLRLDRFVALKVLPQHLVHYEDYLKRFHEEARKAAQLDHPNIVKVYDEGEENGVHFIAMQYIDGQNLKDIIVKNGPLTAPTMLPWLKPITEALGYAHKKGMIHRDIKSANILISQEGRAMLTDFGIARFVEDAQRTRADVTQLTRPGTILGTLQFMSPEQVQGKPVDARSDIYSLGVAMYQCLTGELPFRGDTDWSAMHKINNETPTAPRSLRADIPPALEAIVLRCMNKKAENRFQSCSELLAELELVEPAAERVPALKPKVSIPPPAVPAPQSTVTILPSPGLPQPPPKTFAWRRMAFAGAGVAIIAIVAILFLMKRENMGPGWKELTEVSRIRVKQLLRTADSLYKNDNLIDPVANNAWKSCQEALALHRENKVALEQLAKVQARLQEHAQSLQNRGDYNAAKNLVHRSLRYFTNDGALLKLDRRIDIQILEQQAKDYAAKQQYVAPARNNACETCKKILALDSLNLTAQNILKEAKIWLLQEGDKLKQAGQRQLAAGKYRQGLNCFPNDPDFLASLKDIAITGKCTEMLAEAEKALTQGAWKLAWNKSAGLKKDCLDEQTALDFQQRVIQGAQDEAETLGRQGKFDAALERYRLLKNQFDSKRDLAADEAAVYERWGDDLFTKKLNREAWEKYQAALRNKPEDKPLMARLQKVKDERIKWLDIDRVLVAGGAFEMGDNDGEKDERPAHTVNLSDFYMSIYEITFEQYEIFCKASGNNLPGNNKYGRGKQPVIVNWSEAKVFCSWLTQRTGVTVELPTEAQWEYAARERGKRMKWAGTDVESDLALYAWHRGSTTQPVGQKRPNALGLFDMSGNVYEWCRDGYDENFYKRSSPNDPEAPYKSKVVRRGGSALSPGPALRNTNRGKSDANKADSDNLPTGFRIVCSN